MIFLYHGTIPNAIRMEPLPILMAWHLTWPDKHLGLGLGVLHAPTDPDYFENDMKEEI